MMKFLLLMWAGLALISAKEDPKENHRSKRGVVQVSEVNLNSASGVITSPGFANGGTYPRDVETLWTIHVPNDSVYKLVINVTFLEIENHPRCDWDFLAFGENFNKKLCGAEKGVFTVDEFSSMTKIKFHSDFWETMRGFSATFKVERLPTACDKKPCFNNAACKRLSSTAYECQCSQHYTGKKCEDFQELPCTSYPCLVFEDNFDYMDHKIWEHEITLGGGGNWEFQHYTNNRSNSYIKDGVLYIKPTLTEDNFGTDFLYNGDLNVWGHQPNDKCTGNAFWGCQRQGVGHNVLNPIQSARIRSSRGLNFKFGKVEVEAKLPTGDWIWPAIWMMPTYVNYGGWPASGEIDIMESRGNLNYTDANGLTVGADHVGSTLHFGPNHHHNGFMKATSAKRLTEGSFADRFYRYAVEWTEDYLRFTVDDEEIMKITPDDGGFWKLGEFKNLSNESPWRHDSKMAPFDQEFYIILNVAVGGFNYFPDDFINQDPKPWADADKSAFWNAREKWYPTWHPDVRDGEDAALKINHVKIWKLSH